MSTNENHCQGPLSPWDDPNVKAALRQGRKPSDIYLIDCPACDDAGYYNQGSHFACSNCGASFHCINEDELEDEPQDRPYILLGDEYPLSDWEDWDFDGAASSLP